MPLNRLYKWDIIEAVTKSSWTTNFRHLLPVTRSLKRRLNDPVPYLFSKKTVHHKDRIKYWNIVPGDQIRLLGDSRGAIHEVRSINKFRNRVYVRGVQDQPESEEEAQQRRNKNYHYSRCQLYLGEYEFPPQKGEVEPKSLPVFAKRIGHSAAAWNPFLRRFHWERYATATTPIIPHLKGQRIPIPWPKPEARVHLEPTSYDTTKDEVTKVTYQPPPFSPTLKGLIPRTPTEKEFLRSVYGYKTFPAQPALEQYLFKELANPHSRAKKLKRWQEFQAQKKALLKEMTAEELRNLDGRTTGEAKAEATLKWRLKLDEDKKALRKIRWQRRGGEARLERKARRKARKAEKQRAKLTALTLTEAPNQVIPKEHTA